MWVYTLDKEDGLYHVGYWLRAGPEEGYADFFRVSEFKDEDDARWEVHFLNGGNPKELPTP